jgi:hypothetical protein
MCMCVYVYVNVRICVYVRVRSCVCVCVREWKPEMIYITRFSVPNEGLSLVYGFHQSHQVNPGCCHMLTHPI